MPKLDDFLPARFSPHEDEEGRILHYGNPRQELQALRESRAFRYAGRDRALMVTGADRIQLLQRISAGDLAATREGGICPLPFTDAKGRIVDAPWVLVWPDELLVVCGVGRRTRLQSWIEQYTILEDVVCDPQDHWWVLDRSADAPPFILAEHEVSEEIAELVDEGIHPVGELAFAQHSAESLRLRPGLDLDERFNPLEAGLRRDIAFDKGCYIGQEVVARLENYDKVRRRPALLRGAQPLARDAELSHGGKRGAQVVHSATRLDAEGAYALGLLERELQEGAVLRSEDGAEWTVVEAAPLGPEKP